jgi:hypothetical protein
MLGDHKVVEEVIVDEANTIYDMSDIGYAQNRPI